ncbi:MAG: hypothetical protein MJA30_28740 [Cytophagales bacterium]|nr:hypothetical protein [Cytophagales bacterium]
MKKSKRVYTGAFNMITLMVLLYRLYARSNDDESISWQEQATIDLVVGTGYLDNVEDDTPRRWVLGRPLRSSSFLLAGL